jgi:hypothetical protein
MSRPARTRFCTLSTALAGFVTLLVALTTSAEIRIDGDLFVGVWTPSRNRWEASTSVCVVNRDAGGSYRIRVSGTNDGTRFVLKESSGNTINYRLLWRRSGTRGQRERLTPGVASRRVYTYADETGCQRSQAPSLSVRINDRALDRALPGIYTDTLLITIEPI